ncbi:MAG: ATP-binding protein [Oligoflexus sp.]
MILDEIEDRVTKALKNKGEYNDLDFKKTISPKEERLVEHINAFGNHERGGCFILGVDNFNVIGLNENHDETILKFVNLARDKNEPPLHIESKSIEIDGHHLLCIYVYESNTKPVFIRKRDPWSGKACFKRSGGSTCPMTNDEIRFLLAKSTQYNLDADVAHSTTIDLLDEQIVREHIPSLTENPLIDPFNLQALKDYGVLSEARTDKVTNAGWLCFAKQPQKLSTFTKCVIEIQIFGGKTRAEPQKKYTIDGNLPNQINSTLDIIDQNIWKIPKISGARRVNIPAYTAESLREVIVNCVAHRDYSNNNVPVKVAFFSDRIEFENPGSLMPGITPLNIIHKREWRNPAIATLLEKMNYGEMDGQGIDRLYGATRTVKVPAPVFINNPSSFKVILSAPKTFDEYSPDEKRLTVLIILLIEGNITNEALRNAFDIDITKASTLIKSLVEDGMIVQSNKSRKFAKYSLSEKMIEKIWK